MTLNAELLNFSGFVRDLWARQVAITQESPECTEELLQMLIDGMTAVEQTTDMERMRAALDAFDAAPAAAPGWDLIEMPTGQPNVQRLRVPGGWLYQVELDERVYSEASDDPGPDYPAIQQQLRDALLKQASLAAVTPAPVHTQGAVS